MNNGFNQGGFQGQQGGFPGQQGSFAPQPNNFQNQPPQNGQFNPNQNQNGGNNTGNSSSFVELSMLVRLASDPKSDVINNGAKVAKATVAVNHRGNNADTDFWDIEIWVNQGSKATTHDYLMDYCKKGRQVFVKGIPHLKKRKRQQNGQDVLDVNGKAVYDFYPTLRVNELMGLGSNGNSNGGNGQQGNNQQNNFQQNNNQQPPQNPMPNQGQNPGQQGGFSPQPGNFGPPVHAGAPGFNGAPQFQQQ